MAVPRILAAATALLLLAGTAACGDDDTEAAEPATVTSTTSTTTEPTTTTEPADPWAVPDEIDEAYVQRVLTKLYEIQGDATRTAVEEGAVAADSLQLLSSIYADDLTPIFANILATDALDQFVDYHHPPGDIAPLIDSLEKASPRCIWLRARLDYSAALRSDEEPRTSFHHLVRAASNETGWRIESVELDLGQEVEDPCG
jgi:hypothetical protein